MPLITKLNSVKCYNQFNNGADFSLNLSQFNTNLVGNAGDLVRLVYELELILFSQNSLVDWTITTISAGNFRLFRPSGSFLDDGFAIGDAIQIDEGYVEANGFQANHGGAITAISFNGSFIDYAGTAPPDGGYSSIAIRMLPNISVLDFQNIELEYSLNANNEQPAYTNRITGSSQFYRGNFVTPSSDVVLVPQGVNRDWVNSNTECKANYLTNTITITHDVVISPIITNGQSPNATPSFFQGNNCLNYFSRIKIKPSATSPRVLTAAISLPNAFTGWFNENFNGLPATYSTEISYTGASALRTGGATPFVIEVTPIDRVFVNGDVVVLILQRVPQSINLTQNFPNNFIYQQIRLIVGGSPVSNGIFSNVLALLDGTGQVVVSGTVTPTPDQQQIIQANELYMIALSLQGGSELPTNSLRANVVVDLRAWDNESSLSGLIELPFFGYLGHEKEATDVAVSSLNVWNEDGFVANFRLNVPTGRQILLGQMTATLAVDNGSDFFALDEVLLDATNSVVQGNTQQIFIETERPYQLPDNDLFKIVSLQYNDAASNGSYKAYDGLIAFKMKWQDWIANPNAFSQFFNIALPNRGLNYVSSRYFSQFGFTIRVILQINYTGLNTLGRVVPGQDVFRFGPLITRNYGVSDDGQITSGVISLRKASDPDTVTGVISTEEDTLFRIEWTSDEVDVANSDAIHRIQQFNAASDNIEESSSIRGSVIDGLLKPFDGEIGPKLTSTLTGVRSEVLIDATKVQTGLSYNLSGRLFQISLNPPSIDYSEFDYNTIQDYN